MLSRTISRVFSRSNEAAPPVIEVPEEAAEVVQVYAAKYALPGDLLRAIVQVESAGDPWAMRTEESYQWLWDVRRSEPYRGDPQKLPSPSFVSRRTELIGQQTSWGLMQVMGATARELGYRGRFLSKLCDPEFGMEYGCRYLAALHDRFGPSWETVAAAYNAGSPRRKDDGSWINQAYIDRIRHYGGLA